MNATRETELAHYTTATVADAAPDGNDYLHVVCACGWRSKGYITSRGYVKAAEQSTRVAMSHHIGSVLRSYKESAGCADCECDAPRCEREGCQDKETTLALVGGEFMLIEAVVDP